MALVLVAHVLKSKRKKKKEQEKHISHSLILEITPDSGIS